MPSRSSPRRAFACDPSAVVRHQAAVRSLAAFEHSTYADDWRELMRLFLVRRTRSFIQDNYAQTDQASGRTYLVFGDGRQSRDFTYVDNVVEANIAAAAAPKLSGESVNIAAGNPRTVLDVLEAISNEFGYSLPPAYAPDRPGDIRDSHADLGVARSLLGYKATVDFPTGLRRTVEFLREASTVRS